MDNVLVSIVVPVYNVEKYLQSCIDSVKNQTYNNLEIILVDDGSSDLSGVICEKAQKLDHRIVVYHKTNEGLGFTRNFGMKRAHGKYVMFVDSDDYIENNIVERMLIVAEKEKADLVVEGFKKITDDGKILFEEQYKNETFFGADVKNKFLPRLIGSAPNVKDSIFTTVCSKLYLLNKITSNNILFQSERSFQSEDLAFQIDCIPVMSKVVVTNNSGYFYRTNMNSLSTSYKRDRLYEVKKVYNYVINKINLLDLPADTVLRAGKMLFVQLNSVIHQENPRISRKHIKECIKELKKIVSDREIRQVIDNYPIKLLNFKQRVFLRMVQLKTSYLLLLATYFE